MWTGLTSNISPRRNTIATHETMSAWFWMMNSWLITGGFLLLFFLMPMSTRLGPPQHNFFFSPPFLSAFSECDRCSFRHHRSPSPRRHSQIPPASYKRSVGPGRRAGGQGSDEWRVTLLSVGGVRPRAQPTTLYRARERSGPRSSSATQRFGGPEDRVFS